MTSLDVVDTDSDKYAPGNINKVTLEDWTCVPFSAFSILPFSLQGPPNRPEGSLTKASFRQ